jgi:hypothetical protein
LRWRKLILTTAILAIALGGAVGQTAQASSLQIKHKPFSKLTRQQTITVLHKQIHKDHSVIRFWNNHDSLRIQHRWIYHLQVHWARTSLKIATENLHKLTQRATYTTTSGFPPHHQLWLCIHRHEAGSWYDHNSGGNGHYGGLQMHWSWGYGIVGDAGNYSQAQQEWAAEHGYQHGGIPFLYQQWFKWDNAAGECLQYA